MILIISEMCPDCGHEHMQEVNREYKIEPFMDNDLPDEKDDFSLTEWCPNCALQQTKYAD